MTVTAPPRPDATRIAETLRRLATIGADPEGGITRLVFTQPERAAHDFMAERLREVGLEVWGDAFGNTYGRRAGRDSTLPAIAFGSHVDTVPHGGAYDGAVGSVAALEVMRTLEAGGVETEHPMLAVIFAGEEGARFGKPLLGSRAVMGELSQEQLITLRDASGISLAEAMRSVGFNPDAIEEAIWPEGMVGAFFELHIEQGQVLESERKAIGLVDSIAGNTRLRFTIRGNAVHSGATPMHLRHDAVAAAGELILSIEEVANDYRHRSTVATVGRMDVWPNSITTIAGRVVLYADVRDIDGERQREAANRILDLGRRLEDKRGVTVSVDIVSDSSPSILPTWLRRITAETCEHLHIPYRVMPSGAGHDAAVVAEHVPAAMLFIPSQHGLSHTPDEWSSPEDIATGTEVLTRSILALDTFQKDRRSL